MSLREWRYIITKNNRWVYSIIADHLSHYLWQVITLKYHVRIFQ